MTKIWAGPAVGWAYLVCVIDCCTREIVGWNLSHRCRTEDALLAVEQSVLERLPEGSRQASVTLTTDNGTQFTSSRFIETLNRLSITHRRTAYHHPEGNSYIDRFHRSLKEEEVWTAEYRSMEEARTSIARWWAQSAANHSPAGNSQITGKNTGNSGLLLDCFLRKPLLGPRHYGVGLRS